MKLIAIEEHFLPHYIRDAWAKAPGPHDPVSAYADKGKNEILLAETGIKRLELMDEQGVDVQVLSLTTPGLHNLEPRVAIEMARKINDNIAEICAQHPTRFQGFAALPTSSPDEAALELERAVTELGLKGAMLCGRTRDKHLDHPSFHPIFQVAETLKAPLFIHPQTPMQTVREANYSGINEITDLALSSFGLGWHYEAGLQWVRLAIAGIFDEYPNLQTILGHWGEVVLFYLERMSPVFSKTLTLNHPLEHYAKNNLYVTGSGMWSESYLKRCLDIVGTERLLFSTDYPYQYKQGNVPRKFIENLSLDETAKNGLAFGNWGKLTGHIRNP